MFQGLLQLLDAAVGALQRLVLQQHGLHQSIDRIRGDAQTLGDRGSGVRVPRGVFQLGKSVEKVVNQLAFLRCHGSSPSRMERAAKM